MVDKHFNTTKEIKRRNLLFENHQESVTEVYAGYLCRHDKLTRPKVLT